MDRAYALALLAVVAPACARGVEPGPVGADGADPAGTYAALCASCHGPRGGGGTGPALDRLDRLDRYARGEAELARVIDARMPLGAPERCRGDCARALASYILRELRAGGPVCSAPVAPPRQLRLLTRREYRATVEDLLRVDAMPCSADDQCALDTESCVAGRCAPDACEVQTFVLDPAGRRYGAVVVTGGFTGWAASEASGAWPLRWSSRAGRWYAKRRLPDGRHAYKFVADGAVWLTDPANPRSIDDGFGGRNSLLEVACASSTAPQPGEVLDDPAARFPVETRPEGFPFAGAAANGVVTDVHFTESLAAAEALAAVAAEARARLVPCDYAGQPAACAQRFLETFGRRAFRRNLAAAEVDKYRALILAEPTVDAGLRVAAQAMLVSPSFLYRSEIGAEVAPGTYALDGFELASALSYTLWGTMPDDALLAAAERGELATPDGLEREARRLLADPRARRAMANFATEWLGVEAVLGANKQSALFPDFDAELRRAMLAETGAFVAGVFLDGDGDYRALYTADYGLVNARLARHYGIAGVSGAELRRAPLPRGERAGLLGHGSVLATYAHSDQSSPIKRGVFVRERLLCQRFGAPPPDAGGLPPVDPAATTRERFAMHTAKASCSACHRYIDGVGFGFERFDAVGTWREREGDRAVDASGELNDVEGFGTGTSAPFSSLPELGAQLAASAGARRCLVTEWYRYTFGRPEAPEDACGIDALEQALRAADGDVRELLVALVRSTPFRFRR